MQECKVTFQQEGVEDATVTFKQEEEGGEVHISFNFGEEGLVQFEQKLVGTPIAMLLEGLGIK